MKALSRRLFALFMRQMYLNLHSPPRIMAYAFWPSMSMIVWGFLNSYLFQKSDLVNFSMATLLGATLLYNFAERSNINTMFAFLEDVWSRNLGNMLITPLRPIEMIAGYILNGLVMVAWGSGIACLLGYLIFDYSVFSMGLAFLAYIAILVMNGWWVGILLISVIIRYGSSGEHFGWMLAFIIMPFLGVYYPISFLPEWMQAVSWAMPAAYVFESLRQLISEHTFNAAYFYKGIALNCVYLLLAIAVFIDQLNRARKRGGLLSMAE